jgi:SAM-dependent methyltransferase
MTEHNVEMPRPKDTWAAGDLYEPYVGRWSRLVAKEFLDWLEVPGGKDWLDVGCGTGALTQSILDHAKPESVRGIDPSRGFVEHAKQHITDPRASFQVGDAQSLPVPEEHVDAAVSGLVLNFVTQPEQAAAEMARVTRDGGVVAAYVWDYAGKMEMLRSFWDAVVTLDTGATAIDEGNRFPICRPEPLQELFANAGLRGVETRSIDVPTRFKDFDDFWSPFLGGQGPAPSYAAALDHERQTILRDFIRSQLPIRKDGSIHLIARAWAVRGRNV